VCDKPVPQPKNSVTNRALYQCRMARGFVKLDQMPSTATDRVEASTKALGITWVLAGMVFCVAVKGPGTANAWLIWGSGVFTVAWLVVALPLIAIGDRVLRLPALTLAFGGGFAGAFLMLSPNLVIRIVESDVHWAPFSFRDFAWPGVAFAVAFVAVALYRAFPVRSLRDRALQKE
jgi:hypothetical protein